MCLCVFVCVCVCVCAHVHVHMCADIKTAFCISDETYEPEVKSVNKMAHPHQQPVRMSTRQRRATLKAQESHHFIKKENTLFSKPHLPSSKQKCSSLSKEKTEALSETPDVSTAICAADELSSRPVKKRQALSASLPAAQGSKPMLFKRKRGRPCKNVAVDAGEAGGLDKMRRKKSQAGASNKLVQNLKQVRL